MDDVISLIVMNNIRPKKVGNVVCVSQDLKSWEGGRFFNTHTTVNTSVFLYDMSSTLHV